MFKKIFPRIVALMAAFSLLLGACAPAGRAPSPAQGEPVTLRIAVLPILDALPMYIAQQEGLFQARGVNVEFIPVAAAAERDQVIAAGQADGMINEIVSTLFYNKDQTTIQIVRFARTAAPDAPMFRILASQKSGITTVEGLKGVEIGISEGTVIEYLTDRLLEAEGLAPEDIKTVSVPKMPDRMALLGTGELKAGMLPDPLSSLAMQQGAVLVLDDSKYPQYGHSTYSFLKKTIDEHPQAVQAFLDAVEEAVGMINADPAKWTNVLSEQKLVPPTLLESFTIPRFVTASVPDEEQWNDVLAWTKAEGLIDKDVSYQESVNADFLP